MSAPERTSVPALEPVIGLEIHVQLNTRSKMFCGNSVHFGDEPNTHVCPVCLGLPGALPVINGRAVQLAVKAALGLNCQVHETSIFARKNYFYPDLPKGYQISQFEQPLATAGWLDVATALTTSRARADGGTAVRQDSGMAAESAGLASAALPSEGPPDPTAAGPDALSRRPAVPPSDSAGAERRVRIRRVHMEEDAGKSIHDRLPGRTAVDLNRAGTPLVEIVTEPDLVSPAHARAFLTRLKQILEYLQVSDCDMEKGSLRVDANISVRPVGTDTLGTKTEVKNMNSFSNVERALAFEIRRQLTIVERGGTITQETLLWDAGRGEVRSMRSKEESHDYRYFPEPDLPPLVIPPEEIDAIRASLPELPGAKLRRFQEAYGLPLYDAEVLTATRDVADYFEGAAAEAGDAKAAANWVMTDVLGWANAHQQAITSVPLTPEHIGQLVRLVADGTLSSTLARKVFERSAQSGRAPAEIVRAEGLAQVRDAGQLEAWVDETVAANPSVVERYRAGEVKLLGFLMGEIMKKSRGKADPRQATELLKTRLSG